MNAEAEEENLEGKKRDEDDDEGKEIQEQPAWSAV